jgi:hypothetical protein
MIRSSARHPVCRPFTRTGEVFGGRRAEVGERYEQAVELAASAGDDGTQVAGLAMLDGLGASATVRARAHRHPATVE